jgi:ABC-type branched-subunit amino acid transport system substrate-binding protein
VRGSRTPYALAATAALSAAVLALLTLAALPALPALSAEAPARGGAALQKVARIGVELPLAGDDGADGLAAWQSVQLALEEWNANPAHVPVEAVLRDTSHHGHRNPHLDEGLDNVDQPESAAAIVREFAADPLILAVVGALRTNVAAAEAPVARALRLPIVSIGASNASQAERIRGAPALFRIAASDVDEGALAGTIARRRRYRSVGRIEGSGEAAREVARGFARSFPEAEAGATRPDADASDALLFAAPLARGTFLVPHAAAAAILSPDERRRMEHRGYAPVETHALYDRIERAPLLGPPAADAVEARYHARFGIMPGIDALDAYVATQAALVAIERAGGAGRRDARAQTLAALRGGGLPSIAGRLGFTRDGGPLRSCFSVLSIRDGAEAERFRACRGAAFP